MNYLTASEIAKKWCVSERSVRNYCAQGRVQGAVLNGKTWQIPKDAGRVILEVNKEITLDLINCENNSRTFTILKVLGCGGTAIAYKVSYDGADNNRYLYVLKELYPVPSEGNNAISRVRASLAIDDYEKRKSKLMFIRNKNK